MVHLDWREGRENRVEFTYFESTLLYSSSIQINPKKVMLSCFTLELKILRKLCQTAPSPTVTLPTNKTIEKGKDPGPLQSKKKKKSPLG